METCLSYFREAYSSEFPTKKWLEILCFLID